MFGIDSTELLIIAVVALVVIGPKDLPRVMRQVGEWVARARGMAKHFRVGMDAMIRESELEDMERKWKEDNARIMREHPVAPADPDWGAAPAEPLARPIAPPGPPRRTPLPAGEAPPAPPRHASTDRAPPPAPPALPPSGELP